MHAHALFCDDIRQEKTEKLIYVGVYQGEMHSLMPNFLQRFCIAVTLEMKFDEPVPCNVRLLITLDDEVIRDTEIDPSMIKKSMDEILSIGSNEPVPYDTYQLTGQVVTHLDIQRSSVLTAKWLVDGVEIRAGRLRIKEVIPQEQPVAA